MVVADGGAVDHQEGLDEIKKALRKMFGQTGETKEEEDFAIAQMTMSFSQWEAQSIQAYVGEEEQMSKSILSSKLEVAVICGLHDDTRRNLVNFANRGKKRRFAEAVDLIKAAYRSVGKLDPFKTRQDRPRFNDTSPYYAMPPPSVPIAAASVMAPRPVSTDGIRPRPGMQLVGTTREQPNDYPQMHMTE